MKDKKILYFEGAGIFGTGAPIGNCRIRTALTNDAGKRFYIELMGNGCSKEQRKYIDPVGTFKNDECIGWVDSCHEITEDPETDDENKNRHPIERNLHFKWTLEGIRYLINENLGCSFDEVRIAPEFSTYRVFRDTPCKTPDHYRFGDEYTLDVDATEKTKAIYEREYARQKSAGEKHPCLSVWRDHYRPNIVHVLHFCKCGLGDFDEII